MAAGFGEGVSDVSDELGAAVVDWRESDRRQREGEKRQSSIRGGVGLRRGWTKSAERDEAEGGEAALREGLVGIAKVEVGKGGGFI